MAKQKNEKEKSKSQNEPFYKRSLGGISKKDVLFFTRNLLILYKSGSTLLESVDVLRKQTKGPLNATLKKIFEFLTRGQFLSDALSNYPKAFSPLYISLIRVGENSGTLEENLEYLVKQLEANQRLRQNVRGALFYPAMIMIATVVLALAISFFILPKLTKLFANFKIELPFTTRIILGFATLMEKHGLLVSVGVIAGGFLIYKFLRMKFLRPVTHWLLLHLPLCKQLTMHLNVTYFCRTMGILLKTGVTINQSLEIAENTVQNYYYKKFVTKTRKTIEAGDALTSRMLEAKDLFNPTDVQIIQVGEKTGGLSDSLFYCADIHERGAEDFTKNLVTILEPLMLLFVGGMVGVLALSIVTPIYSITNQFRA